MKNFISIAILYELQGVNKTNLLNFFKKSFLLDFVFEHINGWTFL